MELETIIAVTENFLYTFRGERLKNKHDIVSVKGVIRSNQDEEVIIVTEKKDFRFKGLDTAAVDILNAKIREQVEGMLTPRLYRVPTASL